MYRTDKSKLAVRLKLISRTVTQSRWYYGAMPVSTHYATAAGIAVSYPLVPDVRKAVTTKTVLLIDLLLQALLSFICAQTTQMDIVIVCSFWIGILKGFAMIEVIS